MNPSAPGWIRKHLAVFDNKIRQESYEREEFYNKLREVGFIYAHSVSTISYPGGTTYQLTLEEISKINLFDSMAFMYFNYKPHGNFDEFMDSLNAYYDYLKKNSWFQFNIPFIKPTREERLEKIIHDRIRTNESLLKRNFSALIANALLFLDVLAYKHFLETDDDPILYAKSMEALLANTFFLALKKKSDKTTHEEMVLKLIDASLRYNKVEEVALPYEKLNYGKHQLPLECLYILDLACLTVYADDILENKERKFILKLASVLGFSKEEVKTRINNARKFIDENKEQIHWLDDSNPFRNLYDNTYQMASLLIIRNKKRLSKEIGESKELAGLLMKSTSKSLSNDEKIRVREQLLDICKAIPSLTVFMLPGGTILLPLLVKLIPDLLPSAFADNRIKDKE